jgi:hypothetical protein
VPLVQDASPSPPSNLSNLLAYVDNHCNDSRELFASGCSPLNGILRDTYRYLSNQWVFPGGAGPTYPSPLTSVANGERPCRSVNAILIMDGDETCDLAADAVDAAADLLAGFTKDGITWHVRTFVINISNQSMANSHAIASAGGTGAAYGVTSDIQLSAAIQEIIAGANPPETCDNVDNDCNGCVDDICL